MKKFAQKIYTISACLMFSSLAQAGSTQSGSISFVPHRFAIPTLSSTMLVVLGLLLVVIALRVLKPGTGMLNKVASIAILGSGLILGGYGIDASYASGNAIALGNACSMGVTLGFNGGGGLSFVSQCPNAVRITDITMSCDGSVVPGSCSVESIIRPGESCGLPSCGDPD